MVETRQPIGVLLALLGLLALALGAGLPAPAGAADLTASSAAPTLTFHDTGSNADEWSFYAVNANPYRMLQLWDNVEQQDVVILWGSPNSDNSITVDTDGKVRLAQDTVTVDRANRRLGINTLTPQGPLHISGFGTPDLFAGRGPDLASGPAFNFGYAGSSFGPGAGFLNVRPAAGAVAPNPSLRFATNNVQRMIITAAGRIGIGLTLPRA